VAPCPADALPKAYTEDDFDLSTCAGAKIEACLQTCKGGNQSDCYSAAILLQQAEKPAQQTTATALYARACKLGSASACTNWGAGLNEVGNEGCLLRTYKATCKAGRDPWGCSMYARALHLDDASELTAEIGRDLSRIACRLGADDPACVALKQMTDSLAIREPAKK
jgi:hypothetical protein